MKKTVIMLCLMLISFVGTTFSQTISTKIYTNYGYGFDKPILNTDLDKNESSFNIKDVFLGANYNIDEKFSAAADIRYDGKLKSINLYTANISYHNNISTDLNIEVSLGQFENYWYSYTNNIWNNYAIDNVLSDKFNLINRTGVGLMGKLINKNVTGVVQIDNGKNNKNKSYAFNVILSPFDNFKIGGIYNYKNTDTLSNINVFGVNATYQINTKKMGSLKLYGEYLNCAPADTAVSFNNKQQAFSFFGEYYFNESPFSIIAKYDKIFNGENTEPYAQYIIGGINYTPTPLYKFGLNWRNLYYYNSTTENKSHNEIYFTAGFTF